MHPCTHCDGAEQVQEVVGHLDVVRMEMNRGKKGGEGCTTPNSAAVRQHHSGEHARHGRDGTHLGRMACSEVQDVQTGQTKP